MGRALTARWLGAEHPLWLLITEAAPRAMKCAEVMRVGDILEAGAPSGRYMFVFVLVF